jgi:hypothetical protein
MEAAEMTDHVERSSRFLDLHHGEQPLLLLSGIAIQDHDRVDGATG